LAFASLALLFVALSGGAYTSGATDQQAGVTCVNCHNSAKPTAAAAPAACVKCHANADGRYVGTGAKKYVGDGGAIKTVNPHQSHLVELPCTQCHKTHAASVNYCNQCHLFSDMSVK
jgi:fumarate reductase flavoprotein subunit